jgi:hypothetical protein
MLKKMEAMLHLLPLCTPSLLKSRITVARAEIMGTSAAATVRTLFGR